MLPNGWEYVLPVFLIWGLFYIIREKQKVNASKSWPFVKGKIVTSEVKEVRDPEGMAVMYNPYIEYTYTVNAKEYISNGIYSGDEFISSSMEYAQNQTGKYPINAPVNVYYTPDNPNIACLEQKSSSYANKANYAFIALIILLLLIGIITIVR